MIALSTELALLVACDLADDAAFGARLAAATKVGIDWDRFIAIARGNGMEALAVARISSLLPDVLPAALLALPQRNAILQLVQSSAAVKLMDRLAQDDVRSLLLKGMALNHTLYAATPHWRNSSDIDVLVASADLPAADRILTAAGYRRQWPDHDVPAGGRAMFLLLANVFEYICPETGVLIELHHRITLNPFWLPADFDRLYAASSQIDTGQGLVRGLDGPFLVAYLCWHAFAHFRFRLKWFCDIFRARQLAGGTSCAGLCPPQAGFAAGPVALADALLATIMAASEYGAAAVPAGPWRKHVLRIIADMENPRDIPTARSIALLGGEIGFRLFLMRLSPGIRGKSYELLRALSDPRDAELLKLGTGFAPLYAVLGPLLALRRFALRPRQ